MTPSPAFFARKTPVFKGFLILMTRKQTSRALEKQNMIHLTKFEFLANIFAQSNLILFLIIFYCPKRNG